MSQQFDVIEKLHNKLVESRVDQFLVLWLTTISYLCQTSRCYPNTDALNIHDRVIAYLDK